MEHVLVTGGAGFIGTALINHLNHHGYRTSCFDHHPQRAVTDRMMIGDLLMPSSIQMLETLHGMYPLDRVIHLAAQVGRMFGEQDLRYTVRENAEMTATLAAFTGRLKIPLVYTSTSEIYGNQGDVTCQEDKGPFGLPHNFYGLSKRWGEEVSRLYNSRDLIIWRPSMPYGPGAPPGRGRRAMDNMLWQAHHGKKIPVHRGAERSWCWIGDTVEAMRMTIEAKRRDHEPAVYNIGRDDDPRSMLEIAEKACAITGADFELIELVDPPNRQTVVKRLSTEKIRALGWSPKVELDEGMAMLSNWVALFDEEGRMAA